MTTTPRPADPPPPRPDAPAEPVHTQSLDVTIGVAASGKPADPVHRIGDFTILGEGGMGTVYRAVDGRLERMAAIETMKPELAAKPGNRERFVREARAAAVEHDNIVPIWQIGDAADGQPLAIEAPARLPAERFKLTWVGFKWNDRVNDTNLVRLKDCKNLKSLDASRTPKGRSVV